MKTLNESRHQAEKLPVTAVDVAGIARSGKLKSLTVDQLKAYLDLHRLSKAGKKAELVERVEKHVQQS